MYDYLKSYITDKEFGDSGQRYIFYKVSTEEITLAEKRMGKKFPQELYTFYKEVGYGYFYDKSNCFINVLMNPKTIADFVCEEGDYYYAEEREFLKEEDLVFYEIESNMHIYI